MSVFEAEVRHRMSEEDSLTAKVFGTLSLLNKNEILSPFFSAVGLRLTPEEIPTLTVRLWRMYGDVEPDVIIETSKQLAFIEVKLDSPVSSDQLEKEFRAGSKAKKPFNMLLLTKGYRSPQAVADAEEHLTKEYPGARIGWIRWQDLYLVIKELVSRDTGDSVSLSLLKEVMRLLESKRLRGTMGIRADWLERVAESQQSLLLLCEEIAIIAQELNSRVIAERIEPLTPGGTASNLDRDGRGATLSDPANWFPKYFELAYRDRDWAVTQFGHRHLYARFYLTKKEADVGFIIACNKGKPQQDILDVQHQLFEELQKRKGVQIHLIPYYASKATGETEVVDTSSSIDAETLSSFLWMDIRYTLTRDLAGPAIIDNLLHLLVDLRNIINEVELYPKRIKDKETEGQVDSESGASPTPV